MNAILLNELKIYIDSFNSQISEEEYALYPDDLICEKCFSEPAVKQCELVAVPDIRNFVEANKSAETFSTRVLKLIDESGKQDAEIYKAAGIDRRVFSKLRGSRTYQPSKPTAVSLCLALRLDRRGTDEMLELAGFSLSATETADLVIMFFIDKAIFDFSEINEALDYFGCKTLGTE